ncbi:hypothetical protein YPC_1334 [Yersinia pestis biovar Medievalis str. Harbin 35]|nr:hypothetical protein YPC_1334 [Yersinia pestis biovar Medievalis str. Harbin 35]EEO77792.1 hypothetical protein YP516_1479 [Yersinia pestis Nepal516]EEO79680.1 hypothetical protein YPF_3669 [Yersinia pestis biovar Orientalis str. India 195]EEO85052.1 hypothetical protein YPH_0890 [Yersinia pestis biovar Orientalis str. PEXU2]
MMLRPSGKRTHFDELAQVSDLGELTSRIPPPYQ